MDETAELLLINPNQYPLLFSIDAEGVSFSQNEGIIIGGDVISVKVDRGDSTEGKLTVNFMKVGSQLKGAVVVPILQKMPIWPLIVVIVVVTLAIVIAYFTFFKL